jgi:hypothetical protein
MLKQHQAKAFYKTLKHDSVTSDIESEMESDESDDEFWEGTDKWLTEEDCNNIRS